jgi:hypothetical protein
LLHSHILLRDLHHTLSIRLGNLLLLHHHPLHTRSKSLSYLVLWLTLHMSLMHHCIVKLRASHLIWHAILLSLSWNLLHHLLVVTWLLGLDLSHDIGLLLLLRDLLWNHPLNRLTSYILNSRGLELRLSLLCYGCIYRLSRLSSGYTR